MLLGTLVKAFTAAVCSCPRKVGLLWHVIRIIQTNMLSESEFVLALHSIPPVVLLTPDGVGSSAVPTESVPQGSRGVSCLQFRPP